MPHYDLTALDVINSEHLDVLSQQRYTPLVLSGVFLELTRKFYSVPENLHPATKIWSDENSYSELYIEPDYSWDAENNNRRPAIIVGISDLTYDTAKYRGIGERTTSFDVKTTTRVVTGSVLWVHLGKSRGQALQYAGLTLDLVDAYSDIIAKDFCFDRFDLRGITKARQRKDQPKDFESTVQADFSFQEAFQLKFESPKLKTISVAKQPTVGTV